MKNRFKILNTMRKIRRAHKERQIILDYMPLRLWVELTNICNLKCRMCPNSSPGKSPRGYMSLKTFQKIIDQTHQHVYDINLCHRGESLLNKDIAGMVAYAKKMKVATRLNTNATVLDEKMSRELIEAGLDFISFSFDGLDPEKYEKIRIGAKYDQVLQNITTFLKLKKELRSPTPYTMIEILDLPGVDQDPKKLEQFRQHFNSLAVNKITVKPVHNWGGNIEIEDQNTAPGQTPQMNYCPCTNIWYAMVILWDGSVPLCVQDWHDDNTLGNINDCSIVAMWNSETIVNVRELLANEEHQQCEICSHCDLLWRPALNGVPKLNLVSFLSDMLIGYGRARKLIAPIERKLENSSLSGRKAV
jgi:radical SAM protein with 4Fe4S-binding SPASM domain